MKLKTTGPPWTIAHKRNVVDETGVVVGFATHRPPRPFTKGGRYAFHPNGKGVHMGLLPSEGDRIKEVLDYAKRALK